MELLLAGVLALVAGISFGFFGAGGSILLVPILVYVLGLPVKVSLGMALLILVLTGGIAAMAHARSGNVHWPVVLQWAIIGTIGAYGGARVAEFIPELVLMSIFALVVVVSSLAMLRKKSMTNVGHARATGWRIGLVGLALGFFTGIIGVGGGFLLVPALVLLCDVDVKRAIGTSLAIIAVNSLGGFLGFSAHVQFPWAMTAVIALLTAAGSLIGERLGKPVPPEKIRPAFAIFLLLVGSVMVVQNVISIFSGNPH